MSFKVMPIEGDRVGDKWRLVILDEPDYIHALKMAPEKREQELDSGIWLIVAFPVWSAPVRQSVVAAVECAKDHAGRFQLGLRPYFAHDEIYKWWPSSEVPTETKILLDVRDDGARREIHISTDPSKGPVWLAARQGQVFHQGTGPRSKEQLSGLMQAILLPN